MYPRTLTEGDTSPQHKCRIPWILLRWSSGRNFPPLIVPPNTIPTHSTTAPRHGSDILHPSSCPLGARASDAVRWVIATSSIAAVPPDAVVGSPSPRQAARASARIVPPADDPRPPGAPGWRLVDVVRLLIPKKHSIIHMTSRIENMHAMRAPLIRLGMPPLFRNKDHAGVFRFGGDSRQIRQCLHIKIGRKRYISHLSPARKDETKE